MGQPTGEGERGKGSQQEERKRPTAPLCVRGGAGECQGPATPLRPPSKSVFH